MAKDQAAFIDKTNINMKGWKLKFTAGYRRKYEGTLKWDEEEIQHSHPIEEEFSKVHVSGKQMFL